jgi:hypothetical protein|nr:MAG TPA: hypothetical protein [Caudoviricetes sp.]
MDGKYRCFSGIFHCTINKTAGYYTSQLIRNSCYNVYNIVKIVLQEKGKGEGTIVLGITRELYKV